MEPENRTMEPSYFRPLERASNGFTPNFWQYLNMGMQLRPKQTAKRSKTEKKARQDSDLPEDPMTTLKNSESGASSTSIFSDSSKESPSTNAISECIICQDAEVTQVFLPCKHELLCTKCAKMYKKRKGPNAECPVCRAPSTEIITL